MAARGGGDTRSVKWAGLVSLEGPVSSDPSPWLGPPKLLRPGRVSLGEPVQNSSLLLSEKETSMPWSSAVPSAFPGDPTWSVPARATAPSPEQIWVVTDWAFGQAVPARKRGSPPSLHRASRGLQGGAEGRGGHTRTSRAELFRELEGTGRARRTGGRRRGALRAARARERRRRERGPRAPRSLSLRGHQNHFLKLPGRAWPEPPRRKQPFSFPFPAALLAGSGPFLPASHQKRALAPQAFRIRELSWGRRR